MLVVPILIPVLTNFPLPLSDMGTFWAVASSSPRFVHDRPGGARYVERLRWHRFKPRSNGRDPCRADADPVFVGITLLARRCFLRRQSSACVELGGLLEPSAPLSRGGLLYPIACRDRSDANPLEHAYRGLYDR